MVDCQDFNCIASVLVYNSIVIVYQFAYQLFVQLRHSPTRFWKRFKNFDGIHYLFSNKACVFQRILADILEYSF